LFLLVENLRYYLESEEIRTAANGGIDLPHGNETKQTPLLLGRRFAYMGDMKNIFDSGGSGYTMNKAALKTLVVEGFPNYFPHMQTFSEGKSCSGILSCCECLLFLSHPNGFCCNPRYDGCKTIPQDGRLPIRHQRSKRRRKIYAIHAGSSLGLPFTKKSGERLVCEILYRYQGRTRALLPTKCCIPLRQR
jgi:hypothetical protein